MDATWKDGDYFIRLRPIIGATVTQEDFEQRLIINLMQLINAHHVEPPTRKMGVRVQSYGSFDTARVDMIEDVRTEVNAKYDAKKAEKLTLSGNREMRQWAIEIQEIASLLESINRVVNYLKKA